MTFTKSQTSENTYRVISGGDVVGTVRRVDQWTVRGTRKSWVASRAGKYVGSFPSRIAAGQFLTNHSA